MRRRGQVGKTAAIAAVSEVQILCLVNILHSPDVSQSFAIKSRPMRHIQRI